MRKCEKMRECTNWKDISVQKNYFGILSEAKNVKFREDGSKIRATYEERVLESTGLSDKVASITREGRTRPAKAGGEAWRAQCANCMRNTVWVRKSQRPAHHSYCGESYEEWMCGARVPAGI